MPANPNPQTAELVPVTQADRDRAASLVSCKISVLTEDCVRTGKADGYGLVQAFAAHRLAHAKEQAAGVKEGAVVALTEIKKLALAPINKPKLLMMTMRAIASLASDALAAPASSVGEGIKRYRHKKRGTLYEVIGQAELQMNFDALVDGSAMVVYRGEDGKLWVREEGEFHDGRFEEVGATPDRAPEHGELASLVEAVQGALRFFDNAPLESGVCCCGDPIEGHGYHSGHSPVDDLAYHAGQVAEHLKAALHKLSASQGGDLTPEQAAREVAEMSKRMLALAKVAGLYVGIKIQAASQGGEG